jgi:hypothetical protein
MHRILHETETLSYTLAGLLAAIHAAQDVRSCMSIWFPKFNTDIGSDAQYMFAIRIYYCDLPWESNMGRIGTNAIL